jgi:DNA-binding transcriptional ArsR family regulator
VSAARGKGVDALLHPVRLAIVQQLEIGSRRMTIADLAAELPEIAQATLYRHVNALVEADICRVVERRKVHSVEERVYAIRSPDATILQLPDSDDSASADAPFDAIALFLSVLNADFAASKRSRKRLRGSRARFVSTVAHLTDDDVAELARIRDWIVGLRRRPVPKDARPRMVALLDFPYVRDLAVTTGAEDGATGDPD